jgi:glycosyltransferase involved in cell wall biosynthesis
MSRTILLLSLRANPAFVQHLAAYAKGVSELGYSPAFLLDPAYKAYSNLEEIGPCLDSLDSALAAHPSHAIFLNPAMANVQAARRLKKAGARILYLYHEPWQMSRQYLQGEGFGASCRATLAHRFTIPLLRIADQVIVPSQFALSVYQASDVRFNPRVAYLPLLYDDDGPSDVLPLLPQKKYFSYIGKPCRAHAFDQFLQTMRTAFQRELDVTFLIASRFPLPDGLFDDETFAKNRDRIEVRCGRLLTNQQINACYEQSICVWNIYRRSTQSGVLPKALMFGTPLLGSNTGSFPEFLADSLSGQILPGDDPQGILEAFQQFQDRLASYAEGCRRKFLSTFYYRTRLKDLARLLA